LKFNNWQPNEPWKDPGYFQVLVRINRINFSTQYNWIGL
jgi:hypothetical protein